MKRYILPAIGVLAAAWAVFSIARTQPHRGTTLPPTPPPVSEFKNTVAAVGLVEASTENISVGSPLNALVVRVFVAPGQTVKAGDPLFELDTRHLRADLEVKQGALRVSRSEVIVAAARADDLKRQLDYAERIADKRAISEEEITHRRSLVETAQAELEEAGSRVQAAESEAHAVEVEIGRSTVRSPLEAEVLQVKLRVGEYASAGGRSEPMVLLGRSQPLHVRVDVDEHEGWKVHSGAAAVGHVRGNADLKTPLTFVRFEPFVIPKKSLTGDSTERVDTRVLQIIYRVERNDLPLFIGQQLDVFIEAHPAQGDHS